MADDLDTESFLSTLSLSQKIGLLSGSAAWYTAPIPGHEDKRIKLCDGPNGVRGEFFFNSTPSSCFPCGTGLASSFDAELAHSIGEALAQESKAKGVHVLLGPTINIPRSPLGGRGFESFAEDPHLSGTIAAQYINGLQSGGVSATVKHYVGNDQETQRVIMDSQVKERALREIYLKPFQLAIKHADPWAIMTSYGRVNGVHASEDEYLLHQVLRKEWGYKGMVMSDWTGTYSTSEAVKAGLDLEMPGPTLMRGLVLQRQVSAGKISVSEIDLCVRRVLKVMKRGLLSGIPFNIKEKYIDDEPQRACLRRAAQDTIVLLKNEPIDGKKLLPISDRAQSIAVIGPNANITVISGGGSARLAPTYTVTPLAGIQKAVASNVTVGFTIGAVTDSSLPLLDPYIKVRSSGSAKPGCLFKFWNNSPSQGFMGTDPLQEPTNPTWTTTSLTTDSYLFDNVDPKVNYTCWISWSTTFTPDRSGDWEFSLGVVGRGILIVDGKLLIDLRNPEPGTLFMGLGSKEVRGTYENMQAGQSYSLEVRMENKDPIKRGFEWSIWGGIRLGGAHKIDPEVELDNAVALAAESEVVVLVVGLNSDLESESFDRPDMDLPPSANTLVNRILDSFPEKTIVVNQSGMPVAMPWVDKANALVQAFYGGNASGYGLADVLFGNVNPSGKLALTFPRRVEDTPPFPSFGAHVEEFGKVVYTEGIYVGYRSYDIRKLAPLFPFGYGLSYTTFKYSNLQVSNISMRGEFSLTVTISNTGTVDGREVVQVYIRDEKSSLPRPVKELKAFTKVLVRSGQSEVVTLHLDREALGFYDDRARHWIAEKGMFVVHVAASSDDESALEAVVELRHDITWKGL